MELYNSLMIDELTGKRKKGYKISFLPLILIVPLFVAFILLAKLNTRSLYIFLSTLVLSIFACLFIYELIENIIKSKDLIRHISNVLSSKEVEVNGVVNSISNVITLKRNIRIVEVEIVNKDARHRAYFNIDLNECGIKVNDSLTAILSNNFIKKYEVISHE